MTALSNKLLTSRDSFTHEQEQSSIFKLPAELRGCIWKLAIASYNDLENPYEVNSHYCRPGFTHSQRIDTFLLQTCKKIYLESYYLPLSLNTIIFWAYRGPKGEPAVQRRVGVLKL